MFLIVTDEVSDSIPRVLKRLEQKQFADRNVRQQLGELDENCVMEKEKKITVITFLHTGDLFPFFFYLSSAH